MHRRSMGISRNIWADASMKDSMWVKTLKSRMLMGCVQMWWKHSKRLRFRYCAGTGGCFADEYHWKDGIGPKENRKKMINTHWGGVVEDNSFGTHEFFELCRQLGCKTYINGNLGSGTVQEMSEWVEYMTFNGVSPMADLRKKNGHEEP